MHIQKLDLEEFRLYRRMSLALTPAGICLSGQNASGKSTLVEAIAMLATMRSPRTSSDRELINFQSGQDLGFPPYARVVATAETADDTVQLELGLQVEAGGEGPLKKLVRVSGKPARALDAVGRIKVVLFAPEDVTLVSGPPSGRRRHLDLFIAQIDSRYLRSLSRYTRVLEQRNSLLRSLSKEGVTRATSSVASQMAFWNQELISYGAYITARRVVACRALAASAQIRFREFSVHGELVVAYRPSIDVDLSSELCRLGDLDRVVEVVHQRFEERVQEALTDELRRGVSIVGPHRDDVAIDLDGMAIGTYGSRGQQRLAVVAIKLAEVDEMAREAADSPIVLLDDVLSELDEGHRRRLLDAVGQIGSQLVLTATEPGVFEMESLRALPKARVSAGAISID